MAATIAQVALLAGPRRRRMAAAGLGMASPGTRRRVSVAWSGPVPCRVAALLAPPPPSRMPLVAAAALIVVMTGASALRTARDLHALLELAGAVH
ncbi:MAG TPA: hypothetical protein VMV92_09655 [Streptosporangiaceae bacterium]|nr:hypothetical protein [Streptosporangiaceae bacterium]